MIKWIGQHIVSLIARFRDDVYLENLTESTQDHVVGIDDDGKLYKQDRGTTDSFTVEDGDTTDVVISNGKHWKFVEGGGININWTDTSTGSSTDEYDLTFTLTKTLSDLLQDESHVIRGVAPHDVLIQSAQNLKFQIDYDESSTAGTHTFDFINGAGSTVATIDESGVPTFSIGGKGSAASSVIVDGGSGSLTSRTLAEFKSDASLSNVENKSSATIRGEIVAGDIPTLNQDTTGTATNATNQIVVTTHNFQLTNDTTIKNYVPFNNLNESVSGGPMNNYWTRTLAPYPGTIKKIAVRSQTSLGSSCELRISKITDTTDKLEDGTHVDNTNIDLSTAQTTVITTMNTNSFAAGDAVGVALQRSAGTAAQVIVTIVWEYTT
jgi:hypothetical protein|tara:strand:- start:409 stop:1548 length:1140 start_codon:yes stop_codon:yes gene_type:complete